MAAMGMFGFLLTATGIDNPENDMNMVYISLAICITVAAIGATMADMWA